LWQFIWQLIRNPLKNAIRSLRWMRLLEPAFIRSATTSIFDAKAQRKLDRGESVVTPCAAKAIQLIDQDVKEQCGEAELAPPREADHPLRGRCPADYTRGF